MKKAKIMLSAIAALAVVGGALAFKAHTNNSRVTFTICNTGVIPNTCAQTIITGATDVESVPGGNRNVTVTNATLDASAAGLHCDDQTHPCQSTVYYQDGQPQ
jgi:hypothetical protein